MRKTMKLAVVGVGRIGVFHARHVQELGAAEGTCELAAVVDGYGSTAKDVARALQKNQASEIRAFKSTSDLADARLVDAAVVASRTGDHEADARTLIDAGYRVMLEKPLTHSVESAAHFVRYLSKDNTKKHALNAGLYETLRRPTDPWPKRCWTGIPSAPRSKSCPSSRTRTLPRWATAAPASCGHGRAQHR